MTTPSGKGAGRSLITESVGHIGRTSFSRISRSPLNQVYREKAYSYSVTVLPRFGPHFRSIGPI